METTDALTMAQPLLQKDNIDGVRGLEDTKFLYRTSTDSTTSDSDSYSTEEGDIKRTFDSFNDYLSLSAWSEFKSPDDKKRIWSHSLYSDVMDSEKNVSTLTYKDILSKKPSARQLSEEPSENGFLLRTVSLYDEQYKDKTDLNTDSHTLTIKAEPLDMVISYKTKSMQEYHQDIPTDDLNFQSFTSIGDVKGYRSHSCSIVMNDDESVSLTDNCNVEESRKEYKSILSKKSTRQLGGGSPEKDSLVRIVSFCDEDNSDDVELKNVASVFKVTGEQLDVAKLCKADSKEEHHQDILSEGQYYLSLSVLFDFYYYVCETTRLGLAQVNKEGVSVNSTHYDDTGCFLGRSSVKYLSNAKTARSIIRMAIDELKRELEHYQERARIRGPNNKRVKAQIKKLETWIINSSVAEDEGDKKNITEPENNVARDRWKWAPSLACLRIKRGDGKPPGFESSVLSSNHLEENRSQVVSEVANTSQDAFKNFHEGSIMDELIKSGTELIWFNESRSNGVVFGMCCNREQRKVIVVFREIDDISKKSTIKAELEEYRNPIKTDYPDKSYELGIYSSYASFLMRKRRDSSKTNLLEIFDWIDVIGREMAPRGDYKICFTGYAIGGALATIAGLFAAAKLRFSHVRTIYVWTYGCPQVGDEAFMHASQHLERCGRLKHARFSTNSNYFSVMPKCMKSDDFVGMHIILHDTGIFGKLRLQQSLDVRYHNALDWAVKASLMCDRMCMKSKGVIEVSPHSESSVETFQQRLEFSRRRILTEIDYNITLDDYYHIKANITSENVSSSVLGHCTRLKNRITDPARAFQGVQLPVPCSKARWMPNDICEECFLCEAPFNLLRRKHHCRLCGFIFCSSCSSYFVHLPGELYSESVGPSMDYRTLRVCKTCHNNA